MSKSGAKEEALDFLKHLYDAGATDAETAGILAGVYKDLFKSTTDTHFATKSLEIYSQNYLEDPNYYTGINVATMSQIVGDGRKAKQVADEIINMIGDPDPADYWAKATLGEAYLIKKDYEQAEKFYEDAARTGSGKFGQLNSSYAQLLLLKHYLAIPKRILGMFAPPGIAAFTGHMIDNNRASPRFPESITDQVKEEISKQLHAHGIRIGFTSLACGSDILFAEALLELGGEVNAYLPFNKHDFLQTSVAFAGDRWVDRFYKVIERSRLTHVTEESFFNDNVLFDFLGKVIIGSSVLRGSLMHSQPMLLSVLSEKDQLKKTGGTRSVIDLWPYEESHININSDQFVKEDTLPVTSEVHHPEVNDGPKREVRYILFADIVGFSKLEEEQTPQFMHVLLRKVADELADYPRPSILNTWGDSIFAIYRNAQFSIEFALKIQQIFTDADWESEGLPKDLKIRIALHAGPVFVGKDPLTEKMNVYGSHINRAARMEPVTLPGRIYGSSQFAAALVAENPGAYNLQHVGIIELAKNYGQQEVYMIDRKQESRYE